MTDKSISPLIVVINILTSSMEQEKLQKSNCQRTTKYARVKCVIVSMQLQRQIANHTKQEIPLSSSVYVIDWTFDIYSDVVYAELEEPRYEKPGFLHLRKQRRSAFVFATRIVQSLYFLSPKFQASRHLL